MQNEIVRCFTINVDCAVNDPVDVRAGGPEYLGFDFYVKKEEVGEIIEFVSKTLNDLEVPLLSLSFNSKERLLNPNEVWTKERIYQSIKRDKDFIIREAARNYGSIKPKQYVKK